MAGSADATAQAIRSAARVNIFNKPARHERQTRTHDAPSCLRIAQRGGLGCGQIFASFIPAWLLSQCRRSVRSNTRKALARVQYDASQAARADENRTRMLAAISHDLRTPLTLLRLRVENVENPPEREKMLATIAEMDGTSRRALGNGIRGGEDWACSSGADDSRGSAGSDNRRVQSQRGMILRRVVIPGRRVAKRSGEPGIHNHR